MNQRVKKLWVEALRSGEYQQGTGALKRYRELDFKADGTYGPVDPKDCTFCCLGVLTDLYIRETEGAAWENGEFFYPAFRGEEAILHPDVAEWAGIDTNPRLDLGEGSPSSRGGIAALNDGGETFTTIADLIEEQL